MNISHFTLKATRKIFQNVSNIHPTPFESITDPQQASKIIFDILKADAPCMIARFGSTEMNVILNYLSVNSPSHSILKFLKGEDAQWWWNKAGMLQMQEWSGFYPPTIDMLSKFSEMMIKDASEVDVLGSWLTGERKLIDPSKVSLIKLPYLEPYHSTEPWSRILRGKRILVVHPFYNSILSQYSNREKIFKNPDVLPEFANIDVIPAVQSIGQNDSRFQNWFEALEWMKSEIDHRDYDICLIGCGAYGFPLAAHVKRNGKKAIHLGGALQLLFGIKGRRWCEPTYGKQFGIPPYTYQSLFNEYWVKPSELETPSSANRVEGGCYW